MVESTMSQTCVVNMEVSITHTSRTRRTEGRNRFVLKTETQFWFNLLKWKFPISEQREQETKYVL